MKDFIFGVILFVVFFTLGYLTATEFINLNDRILELEQKIEQLK